MSTTSAPKKGFGVYCALLSGNLALAAGIFYYLIGGVFGAMNRQCFDPIVMILLCGTVLVVMQLSLVGRDGLACAMSALLPGIALCKFAAVHDAYWYVADVFTAIDEHGFDPNFLIFAGLVLGAFVLGEIAIYAPKACKAKA